MVTKKNKGRTFTKIDNVIFQYLPKMRGSTLRVYMVLAKRLNTERADNIAWPSYPSLMKDTGIRNRDTISNAIKELEGMKLIKKENRFNDSSIYTLLYPEGSTKIVLDSTENNIPSTKNNIPSTKSETIPSTKSETLTRRILTRINNNTKEQENFPSENSTSDNDDDWIDSPEDNIPDNNNSSEDDDWNSSPKENNSSVENDGYVEVDENILDDDGKNDPPGTSYKYIHGKLCRRVTPPEEDKPYDDWPEDDNS